MIKRLKWNVLYAEDGDDPSSSSDSDDSVRVGTGAADAALRELAENDESIAMLLGAPRAVSDPRELADMMDGSPRSNGVEGEPESADESDDVASSSYDSPASSSDPEQRAMDGNRDESDDDDDDDDEDDEDEEGNEAAGSDPGGSGASGEANGLGESAEEDGFVEWRECQLCPGKRLLSDFDVEQHLLSRQHKRAVKRLEAAERAKQEEKAKRKASAAAAALAAAAAREPGNEEEEDGNDGDSESDSADGEEEEDRKLTAPPAKKGGRASASKRNVQDAPGAVNSNGERGVADRPNGASAASPGAGGTPSDEIAAEKKKARAKRKLQALKRRKWEMRGKDAASPAEAITAAEKDAAVHSYDKEHEKTAPNQGKEKKKKKEKKQKKKEDVIPGKGGVPKPSMKTDGTQTKMTQSGKTKPELKEDPGPVTDAAGQDTPVRKRRSRQKRVRKRKGGGEAPDTKTDVATTAEAPEKDDGEGTDNLEKSSNPETTQVVVKKEKNKNKNKNKNKKAKVEPSGSDAETEPKHTRNETTSKKLDAKKEPEEEAHHSANGETPVKTRKTKKRIKVEDGYEDSVQEVAGEMVNGSRAVVKSEQCVTVGKGDPGKTVVAIEDVGNSGKKRQKKKRSRNEEPDKRNSTGSAKKSRKTADVAAENT